MVNPMPKLSRPHADFALRRADLGKRGGKIRARCAGERGPAAMGLIINLYKRLGERDDWGTLLAWRALDFFTISPREAWCHNNGTEDIQRQRQSA